MASSSTTTKGENNFFDNIRHFPPVINGRINFVKFLEASTDLLVVVERLGKVFAPAKYDMQGNIDKISKLYDYDDNSCLLELMLEETSKGKPKAAEGVLWLNRALLFFELVFGEILKHLKSNDYYDVSMKKILTVAYEGSLKKYHNWVTQQIFAFICKMSSTLTQLLKSFEAETDLKTFETNLTNHNITLHLVRCKIDDFFKENSLFDDYDGTNSKT